MNVEDLVYITGLFPFFFGILSQIICKGMELLGDHFPLQPVIELAPAAWKLRVNPTLHQNNLVKSQKICPALLLLLEIVTSLENAKEKLYHQIVLYFWEMKMILLFTELKKYCALVPKLLPKKQRFFFQDFCPSL